MAMGTRKMRERQEDLWYGGELPTAPGHPFYQRLNEVLDNAKFDPFCETNCAPFYHDKLGRPSLPPGQYFRVMMIGFFEGLDIVAVTTHSGASADTATVKETVIEAGIAVDGLIAEKTPEGKFEVHPEGVEEVVADKGYHSNDVFLLRISINAKAQVVPLDVTPRQTQ